MRPNLLRLPISHYCKKVEWAMTDLGIDVDATNVWFRTLVDIRDINPENTVPVLELDDRLVCGSHAIMQWLADESEVGHTLYPDADAAAWEQWADATVGPLARRDSYRTLHAAPTKYTGNPGVWFLGRAGRRVILAILKAYKVRRFEDQDAADRDRILGRIGEQLARSEGAFLFGDQKTAADYAVAALVAPLLRIRTTPYLEHPDRDAIEAFVDVVRPEGSPFVKKHRFPAVRERMAAKA